MGSGLWGGAAALSGGGGHATVLPGGGVAQGVVGESCA